MVPTQTRELSELSQVIGELRNFAAQQAVTNTHMLEELKKISDRMANFGEVGATFVEYRKTLHERFGKIHEQIGDLDCTIEKMQVKIDAMEEVIANFRGQAKVLIWLFGVGGTVISSLLSTYGGLVLRVVASHTP